MKELELLINNLTKALTIAKHIEDKNIAININNLIPLLTQSNELLTVLKHIQFHECENSTTPILLSGKLLLYNSNQFSTIKINLFPDNNNFSLELKHLLERLGFAVAENYAILTDKKRYTNIMEVYTTLTLNLPNFEIIMR